MFAFFKALAAIPQLAKIVQWLVAQWQEYEKQANMVDAQTRADEKRASFGAAIAAAQRSGLPDTSPPVQHPSVGPGASGVSRGGESGAQSNP